MIDDAKSIVTKCMFDNAHPLSSELNSIVDENAEYFNHLLGTAFC